MNFEVYKSMDALEAASQLEPDHFFAQMKYAELHYRLRALIKAEQETRRLWTWLPTRGSSRSRVSNCRKSAG